MNFKNQFCYSKYSVRLIKLCPCPGCFYLIRHAGYSDKQCIPRQGVKGRTCPVLGFRYDNRVCRLAAIDYDDVILGAMASETTSFTMVHSTVYSDTDQRKHQSSVSLAFVRGIHRGPVNSPHKWPVTLKMFPFDDVIMRWATCQVPCHVVKSLQLIWRSGTRRSNLRMSERHMSSSDLKIGYRDMVIKVTINIWVISWTYPAFHQNSPSLFCHEGNNTIMNAKFTRRE